MKYLAASILYLLIAALFLGICSLIWEGNTFIAIAVAVLLIWLIIFKNLHRLILVMLGAREIIDTDHQELFQAVKSNVYSSGAKSPRIYSYNGSFKNCFILESSSEWIIVLDQRLIAEGSKDTFFELIEFMFSHHLSGYSFLRTKILGVLVLYYQVIFSFFKGVLRLDPNGTSFRIISTFFIILVRPITILLESYLKREHRVSAGVGLKPLYLDCTSYSPTDVFFALHSVGKPRLGDAIVRYIECFPLIKDCEFSS